MNDQATLARMIENLIRFGTIAETQMKPPRVRVKTGSLLTGWLPWLALRAYADVDWDPPTINEQVILLSPSGQLANAVIEYDSVTHQLRAQLPESGTTELISSGGIHMVGSVTHKSDYTQTGDQAVTGSVTASGDVVAAGISLVKHPHLGNLGAPTSPPQ